MFKRLTVFAVILATAFVAVTFCGCESADKRTSYEIVCEFDGQSVKGTEKVVFYNFTDNAFSELKFNLFANAFR